MSSVTLDPSQLGKKLPLLSRKGKYDQDWVRYGASFVIFFPLYIPPSVQVRKTLDATMQTLQDMLTVEDFDVSDAFQHSRSTESIKSVASESYMSKLNIAKRRANQQETEMFYFSVSLCPFWSAYRSKLLMAAGLLWTVALHGFSKSSHQSSFPHALKIEMKLKPEQIEFMLIWATLNCLTGLVLHWISAAAHSLLPSSLCLEIQGVPEWQ